MTNKPRVNPGALFWYLIITMLLNEIIAAVISATTTGSKNTTATAVVFAATFAGLATAVLWAGGRYLPKDKQ